MVDGHAQQRRSRRSVARAALLTALLLCAAVLPQAAWQRVSAEGTSAPPPGSAAAQPLRAGSVVGLRGTAHAWAVDEAGVLHWVADPRGLVAGLVQATEGGKRTGPVWTEAVGELLGGPRELAPEELRALPRGEAWLSAPPLLLDDAVYVARWELRQEAPLLLRVARAADLTLLALWNDDRRPTTDGRSTSGGTTDDRLARLGPLPREEWERATGLKVAGLRRGWLGSTERRPGTLAEGRDAALLCLPVEAAPETDDCLQADARLRSTIETLGTIAVGQDLLRTAARHGVVVAAGALPKGRGLYEAGPRLVTVHERLLAESEAEDAERAALLAHELRHAADHAGGVFSGRGASAAEVCALEAAAFRTTAEVWAALRATDDGGRKTESARVEALRAELDGITSEALAAAETETDMEETLTRLGYGCAAH